MSWTYIIYKQIIGKLLLEYSGEFDTPEQANTEAKRLTSKYNMALMDLRLGGDHFGDANYTEFSPKTPSEGYSDEGYEINLREWTNAIERGKKGGSAKEGNLYYEYHNH